MLSAVGWPTGFPATHCLDCITEMPVIVCTLVPELARSCCDLLFPSVQIAQLLCQHLKVKSLITSSQAHSLFPAVDSASLCSDLRSASAPNRLNQQWKVESVALELLREWVQGQLRVWIEFHSRLKVVSGKISELILRAIYPFQPGPAFSFTEGSNWSQSWLHSQGVQTGVVSSAFSVLSHLVLITSAGGISLSRD